MKFIIALFTYFFLLGTTFAQWESMNGPYGGTINDLAQNDDFQFAATSNGLYRSSDEGKSWVHLTSINAKEIACLQIAVDQYTVVADAVDYEGQNVKRRLFISTDNGLTWDELFRPASNIYYSISIYRNRIYLADYYSLWVSLDKGKSWSKSSVSSAINSIYNIDTRNGKTYINTGTNLFITSGFDDKFNKYPVPESIGYLYVVKAFDTFLLAESNDKIYRSDNNGRTWTSQFNGLSGYVDFTNIGDTYYANTYYTILKSTDNGITWSDQNTPNFPGLAHTMLGTENKLLLGTFFTGLKESTDSGKTLRDAHNGISSSKIESLAIQDGLLYTGSTYLGVFAYDNETMKWDTISRITHTGIMHDMTVNGEFLIVFASWKVFKTKNHGQTWLEVTNGTPDQATRFYNYDSSIFCGGPEANYLVKGNLAYGNWGPYKVEVDNKLISSLKLFTYSDTTLFVSKRKVIFRSLDNGISWDTAMNGLNIDINNWFTNLHAFGDTIIAIEYDQGPETSIVHISYNNGDDWQTTSDGIPQRLRNCGIYEITNVNGILVASMISRGDGVYVSFDKGNSWQPFNDGLPLLGNVLRIIYDDEFIYAATRGQGVYRRKIADLKTTTSKSITKAESIKVYPNPTSDHLNIVLPDQYSGDALITITDINGKNITSKNIWLDGNTVIETQYLPTGVYFLLIQSDEKQYSSKFVVQH